MTVRQGYKPYPFAPAAFHYKQPSNSLIKSGEHALADLKDKLSRLFPMVVSKFRHLNTENDVFKCKHEQRKTEFDDIDSDRNKSDEIKALEKEIEHFRQEIAYRQPKRMERASEILILEADKRGAEELLERAVEKYREAVRECVGGC